MSDKINGRAVIFSAPSGSGKSSLVKRLMEFYPQLEFSVSATTRSPRGKEKDGRDYFFMDAPTFLEKIRNNEFVEYEEVYQGRYYGTLFSELHRIWGNGNTVIFDVDVVGGRNLKKIFGDMSISFFIKVPSLDVLRERLEKRGTDSQEEIVRRLSKAERESEFRDQFDYVILNDDLEKAVEECRTILTDFLS